jgi:hypothetical protein
MLALSAARFRGDLRGTLSSVRRMMKRGSLRESFHRELAENEHWPSASG